MSAQRACRRCTLEGMQFLVKVEPEDEAPLVRWAFAATPRRTVREVASDLLHRQIREQVTRELETDPLEAA